MTLYNTSFNTLIPSPGDFVAKVNAMSDGLLATMIIIVLYVGWGWVVLRKSRSLAKALMIPGAVLAAVSVLFMSIQYDGQGMIGTTAFLVCLVGVIAGMVMNYFEA